MQEPPPQPLSCLPAPIKVFCHLPPNKYADNPPVSPVRTTATLCNLYHSLASFTFPRPEESISVGVRSGGGPRKSPAVGNCRFYGALEGSETGFKESRTSERAKLKLHPPLRHAAFLPYKAPKYTNAQLYVHIRPIKAGVCVPAWRSVEASIYMCSGLHAHHSHTSSGEILCSVDMVECTDWSSGTPVKTLQVSRLLWLLWRYKETAGGAVSEL